MKHKKFGFSEMVLRHFNNDISKRWYWEWWEKDKRKRRYGDINQYNCIEERLNAANNLRRQLETGLKKPPKPTTSVIYQHLIPYLTKHCELLRSASTKYYSTCLTTFDEWLCNNDYKAIHPKKFTKKEANDYCRFLTIEKNLANATFNHSINGLNLLFGYLIENDIIEKSPFQFIKRKAKTSQSVAAFKEADVKHLKGALKEANTTVYIACMIDMYAFIRPNEIRFLKLKDVDLVNNLIYIDKDISKNKKSQHVAIVPALRAILVEYIEDDICAEHFLLSKSGAPGVVQLSRSYVLWKHTCILKEKGYDTEKFKPYSWKHTGNAIAFKNGASMDFLKMQNRHHSVTMTEIYIKSIVPEDLVKGQEQFFDF